MSSTCLTSGRRRGREGGRATLGPRAGLHRPAGLAPAIPVLARPELALEVFEVAGRRGCGRRSGRLGMAPVRRVCGSGYRSFAAYVRLRDMTAGILGADPAPTP